jgi:hypothetical protein
MVVDPSLQGIAGWLARRGRVMPSATMLARAGESRDLYVVKAKTFEGLIVKWTTIGIVGMVVVRLRRSVGLLL